jgi:hypothetical protein
VYTLLLFFVMSDQLNDFIATQHQTNLHLTESMARVETLLGETTKRLFGGDGQEGALPYIMRQSEETKKEQGERFATIEKRTAKLETWKTGALKWVAGAVAVLALEGSALALYFQHIASKLPGR